VRQRLQNLIKLEQEVSVRRENRIQQQIKRQLLEEQLRHRELIDKLKIGFDLETIRFEKQMQDKAFDIIRALKVQHLDRLITISKKIGEIQSSQLEALQSDPISTDALHFVADDLGQLKLEVETGMNEQDHNGLSFQSENELRQQIQNT
jgi:hypothetical protein